jgi:predicted permease
VRALPGVEQAAASESTPFSGNGRLAHVLVEGRPQPPAGQEHNVGITYVTPGYLEAMSIPVLAGRTIARQDSQEALPAVVIGETLAAREFAGQNPLGKRLRISRQKAAWFTVVGVVKDVKYFRLTEPPQNQAYLAFAQAPTGFMTVVVRAAGDPSIAAQSIRGVVRAIDPNQPVSRIVSITTQIEERGSPQKILMQIIAFFGALALFLAAIGIYGVMAYSVSQRTQEIGIRMALGARGGDVLGLIVRQGMTMVMGGLAAGLAGAVGMARLLSGFLFGVGPGDPVAFSSTIAVLAAVALLACWIPARRAARVDPLVALRYE